MSTTKTLLRVLWPLLTAGTAAKPQCGGAVSSIADASLTKWIQDTEANVSTGSYHVVLGGDRAAHGTALKCALRTAAKAAGAPPSAFGSMLTIDCEGDDCADASWESLAAYLKKRRGKYGVVVFQENTPLWLLKTSAAYFWGSTRCGHASMDEVYDCSKFVWVVSTNLASSALASESEAALEGSKLDKRVQDEARRTWPSRIAGSLTQKAQRRGVFVRGGLEGPAPFLQRVAAYYKQHKTKRDALDHVAGQTEAVDAVRRAVALAKGRTSQKVVHAPPTSFYLYGAPGTGKTRLAEAAAEALGYPLHRLAMESYASVEDANALFGAPPGLQQGVCLVDLLVDTPRSVVVFDEVEKAHPSLFREKLHSALSSGTMTHKRDHTKVASLSETFFFFTSNCFEDAVVQAWNDGANVRDVLSVAINDAPRIPCSSTRQNPFEDASLRSRLGRSKQYPFAPLDQKAMAVAVDSALERAALRFHVDDILAWSPELSNDYAARFFGDARAAAQACTDDLEAALHAAGPRPRKTTGAVFHLKPGAGPWTADDVSGTEGGVGLAWLSSSDKGTTTTTVATKKAPAAPRLATKVATPEKRAAVQTQPEVQREQALDAAYAAYAVAAVVAAVALRMILVAMYAAFWYVAAFSVLGFVAAAVVLGPLEALAVAVAVAKVTAKVAVGAWRGLRLFLRAGGVGPVVVALLAGAYSTRALFQHRRRPVETADKGTMTERRKNRFRDSVSPPARARSQSSPPPSSSRVVEA
jgi:cytochrome c1